MSPQFPPAVIVHGPAELGTCLAQHLPFTLLSAPWAGVYAGVGWWLALATQAADLATANILDCGDAPGCALQALRAGQRRIVLRTAPEVWNDVADRMARCGGRLLTAPPSALDLRAPGAARLLAAHLRGHAEAA